MDELVVKFKLDLIRHSRRSESHGRRNLQKHRRRLAGFQHWKLVPENETERVARTLGVRGYQTWRT